MLASASYCKLYVLARCWRGRSEDVEVWKKQQTVDYGFYITNQIMKPLQQVFALVLEKIPAFKKEVRRFKSKVAAQRRLLKDDEKFLKKEADLRNKAVKELIFDDYLRQSDNMKKGLQNIKGFFISFLGL